jgi:hypothetical protein
LLRPPQNVRNHPPSYPISAHIEYSSKRNSERFSPPKAPLIPYSPQFHPPRLTSSLFPFPFFPSSPTITPLTPQNPEVQNPHQKKKLKKEETYNSEDSLVVTHPTTNSPIQGLCMAERTGCPVLLDLWSYVTVEEESGYIYSENELYGGWYSEAS